MAHHSQGLGATLTSRWLCSARSTSATSLLFSSKRVEGSSVAPSHTGTVLPWLMWNLLCLGGEGPGWDISHCGMAGWGPLLARAWPSLPSATFPALEVEAGIPEGHPREGQVTAQPQLSDQTLGDLPASSHHLLSKGGSRSCVKATQEYVRHHVGTQASCHLWMVHRWWWSPDTPTPSPP